MFSPVPPGPFKILCNHLPSVYLFHMSVIFYTIDNCALQFKIVLKYVFPCVHTAVSLAKYSSVLLLHI